MAQTAIEVQVLIVGAGPVGLFLANECARRGLSWRLVEARESQSAHSKALAIFPRTLEILDMAGLGGPFLEAANRVLWVAVVVRGRRIAHVRFAPPDESPYQFVAMVPQDVTERLLAAQLKARGGVIEYETAFVSAVQEDDSVRVLLDRRGERTEVQAAFVVGCDGAHSAVRHVLDLPFAGAQYDDLFMLADARTNETLPADELQLCPSADGPVAIFPMSATRRRIVATIRTAEGEAPSLALVQRILRERGPEGFEVSELGWSSYFRVHHRHVARLRVGRMFIAGDAAHIHSPFGGQGMNTGLHDAWNLVWKLDLFLHGHGNERLLDSYSAERLPIIKEVLETTHRLTMAMGTPNRVAQLLRNLVIPIASRFPPFQHAFVRRMSELGIAYRNSPIVDGDGRRYFDQSLRGGEGIRSRFLLLLGGRQADSVLSAARTMAHAFSDVLEVRSGADDEVRLVRPDGYTAFLGGGDEGAGIVTAVQEVLERQLQR